MLKLDWNLLFTIINIFVLYLLMKKFLIGPVTAIMDKRKQLIENQFADAEETQRAAEELKAGYEATLQNADAQSDQIIAEARQKANEEYARILDKAGVQADKLVKDAENKIALEREKTLRSMESQIAELALNAADKIVRDKTSAAGNLAMYDDFLVKAGDVNDTDGK